MSSLVELTHIFINTWFFKRTPLTAVERTIALRKVCACSAYVQPLDI